MMERRNTPSPLYLSVTFLANEIRSGTSDFGSSVSIRASSNVIGSSLSNSFSLTMSNVSISKPPKNSRIIHLTEAIIFVNKVQQSSRVDNGIPLGPIGSVLKP